MPELPEVQTTINDLKRKIIGRKITGAWFDCAKLIKNPSPKEFERIIKNKKVLQVERRGKNILIYLSDLPAGRHGDLILLIHQKLTGHLLVGRWKIKTMPGVKYQVSSLSKGFLDEKVNNYIHLILFLDNEQMLALSDLRKFAKVILGTREEIENLPELKKLGLEPLARNFDISAFRNIIRGEKRKIKQILMDQEIISGIGNIYSDEMLWLAKIHPFKPANKLSAKELKALYSAMKIVLRKALKLRGTSVSDYRDTAGKEGKYAGRLYVYQKEGEKCRRCGILIKRVKLSGRSAHFCPACQRLKPQAEGPGRPACRTGKPKRQINR